VGLILKMLCILALVAGCTRFPQQDAARVWWIEDGNGLTVTVLGTASGDRQDYIVNADKTLTPFTRKYYCGNTEYCEEQP